MFYINSYPVNPDSDSYSVKVYKFPSLRIVPKRQDKSTLRPNSHTPLFPPDNYPDHKTNMGNMGVFLWVMLCRKSHYMTNTSLLLSKSHKSILFCRQKLPRYPQTRTHIRFQQILDKCAFEQKTQTAHRYILPTIGQ